MSSSNGSAPPPRRGLRVSRRVALAGGIVGALLIAGVLVAPIVILGSGPKASSCVQTLAYAGAGYDARRSSSAVQGIATGVGVLSGCGRPASNVNVRTLVEIATARAIAVEGDGSSIYVRHGLCPSAPAARLLACLRSG